MSPSTLTFPDMNACMTAAWSWETKAARAVAYSIDRLTSAVGSSPSSSAGCPLLVSRWASIVPAVRRVADPQVHGHGGRERREAVAVLVPDGPSGVDPLRAQELVSHRSAPRIG